MTELCPLAKYNDQLLDALAVFLRYGYRKTSLDDVAQELGVSRQTIYQRYKNKQNLFITAIETAVDKKVEEAESILNTPTEKMCRDIFRIQDVFCGQFVDFMRASPHADEFMDATNELAESAVKRKKAKYIEIIAKRIKAQRGNTLDARDAAEVIYYLSKTLIHECENYADYKTKMQRYLKIILRPEACDM